MLLSLLQSLPLLRLHFSPVHLSAIMIQNEKFCNYEAVPYPAPLFSAMYPLPVFLQTKSSVLHFHQSPQMQAL